MIKESKETAWCPGCGNFPLRTALVDALNELELDRNEVVMFSGIGQAAKMPHYVNIHGFNGLHGRALPPALGAKVANHEMKIIVESGDGCSYGEGGNHLIHNIRRNPDIVHLVHNNQIYGLTKGQASPTTGEDITTTVQPNGVNADPLNPLRLALGMGASFVARAFVGEKEHLKKIIKKAIQHRGYALVDILQPCVSFNKVNTYQWYSKRVYKLEDNDNKDLNQAFEMASKWGDRIPLGIFYQQEKATFRDRLPVLNDDFPLVKRELKPEDYKSLVNEFK
ncbi:MAG: thiamine pyrophosphate-dependent enzyme [Halanaerobiales bacterium]